MTIKVLKEDITNLDVDIIVNAANKSLLGGGGVDGAIHRKAGRELYNECLTLGGCETGEAKMTDAYNLPCKKIIHTVGPVYNGGKYNEDVKLKNCYKNSMLLAKKYMDDNNLNEISIAFPCISTGVYHYPKREAATIAINTIKEFDNEIYSDIVDDVSNMSELMYNSSVESREKDFTDYYRCMPYDSKEEMTAVLGSVKDNDFLKELESDTKNFKKVS